MASEVAKIKQEKETNYKNKTQNATQTTTVQIRIVFYATYGTVNTLLNYLLTLNQFFLQNIAMQSQESSAHARNVRGDKFVPATKQYF